MLLSRLVSRVKSPRLKVSGGSERIAWCSVLSLLLFLPSPIFWSLFPSLIFSDLRGMIFPHIGVGNRGKREICVHSSCEEGEK